MSAKRKETAVACAFCARPFTPRGVKRHERACSRSRCRLREFCVPGLDATTFAIVASFLGNQSVVKMQQLTGGKFPGSNAKVSAICCRCENDELAVENGLCLACNLEEDPEFCETITTTDARRIYGIHDISSVPHETFTVPHRGYYSLFKHSDLQRFALSKFKSKRAWLEMVAAKKQRRDNLRNTLNKHEEQRLSLLGKLPRDFVEYMGAAHISHDNEVVQDQLERYRNLKAALAARHLELRGDSVLCRQFISSSEGVIDDIVDTMEEMKFLFTHTTYQSDCRSILPRRRRNRENWYGYDFPDDDGWISEGELRLRRENIKNRIRDRFVRNPRGLTLPLKWQRLMNQNQGSIAPTTA